MPEISPEKKTGGWKELLEVLEDRIVAGDVKRAETIANRNWHRFSENQKLKIYELFTRPGIRFSERTQRKGINIARQILRTSGDIEDIMRAGGVLYLLNKKLGEHRENIVNAAEKILASNGEVDSYDKTLAEMIKASSTRDLNEAKSSLQAVIDSRNPVAIMAVVPEVVDAHFQNMDGVELLGKALETIRAYQDPKGRRLKEIQEYIVALEKRKRNLETILKRKEINRIAGEIEEVIQNVATLNPPDAKQKNRERVDTLYRQYLGFEPLEDWQKASAHHSRSWVEYHCTDCYNLEAERHRWIKAKSYISSALSVVGDMERRKGDKLNKHEKRVIQGIVKWNKFLDDEAKQKGFQSKAREKEREIGKRDRKKKEGK